MNLCLLCDIVVDAPKLYALESLVSSLAPKSASSSQPPPQQSSKSLSSYAPNSPLLMPAPAPIQEPNDIDVSTPTPNQAPHRSPNIFMEILLWLVIIVFVFAIIHATITHVRETSQPIETNTSTTNINIISINVHH